MQSSFDVMSCLKGEQKIQFAAQFVAPGPYLLPGVCNVGRKVSVLSLDLSLGDDTICQELHSVCFFLVQLPLHIRRFSCQTRSVFLYIFKPFLLLRDLSWESLLFWATYASQRSLGFLAITKLTMLPIDGSLEIVLIFPYHHFQYPYAWKLICLWLLHTWFCLGSFRLWWRYRTLTSFSYCRLGHWTFLCTCGRLWH